MDTHIETEFCVDVGGGHQIICDLYFSADWGRDYDTGKPTLGLSLTHAKCGPEVLPLDMLARMLGEGAIASIEERIAERLLKEAQE